MWSSHLPLDAYALVHMGGAMGDALIAVIGGLLAAAPGVALLTAGGAQAVVNLAAAAYFITMLLTLRLPRPRTTRVRGEVTRLGAIPRLTVAATGTAALKAASGFLL